jgi:hypothetical protein
MTAPAIGKTTTTFDDRSEALGHFFLRAGAAPRLLAFDDAVGCPVHSALSALAWTAAVGILRDDDVVHAARLAGETAAAVVERRDGGRRVYVYLGPRMDAPPADPHEGALLYDEPGVRAYQFAERSHALAHFLRATSGAGALIALFARRGPELRYAKRWLGEILGDVDPDGATSLLAAHFAAGGGGCLFAPAAAGEPHVYVEVSIEP